jgi:hypothetical protein
VPTAAVRMVVLTHRSRSRVRRSRPLRRAPVMVECARLVPRPMKGTKMKIMKRVGVVLLAVGLTVASVAPAAAGQAVGPTFTFNAQTTGLPTAAAAADWSKSTGITAVSGSCTYGATCIRFEFVSFACGQNAPVAGCAYVKSDGIGSWCQVDISQWARNRMVDAIWLDDLVTKHEAGHCIFRALGYSGSAHLDPPALMAASQPTYPTKREATLYSTDRAFTRSLVG